MSVNYDDPRFAEVEADKENALAELELTYSGMLQNSDQYYQDQIEASQDWAAQQTELQNQQTEHTIDQINQQKEQAEKDYIREQSGAYADWQKQSNAYGVNAEKMAAAGLENTGYSETSQVSMYNTYQNRVAVARESYNNAVLNYDNAIKDAQLQNNSTLAEIAYNALQQQLQLSLQGFQYHNELLLQQLNAQMEVEQMYYGRWQDVLNQINIENALAEEQRQANLAHKRAMAQLEEQKRQFNSQQAQVNGGGGGGKSPLLTATENRVLNGANPSNKKGSSDIVIMNSPYSAQGAAEKVASGEFIVTKQVGNQVWVDRNHNYTKGQAMLDKYTSFVK